MSPIPRDIMGDVWPAVEPGRAPSDYGRATLTVDPVGPCVVRSFKTFTITYTAGRFGLDDTGAIRVSQRFVYDGGPLQTADPAAKNYVTARTSSGARLKLLVETHGYRPWDTSLRVSVVGGALREGDTISIVLGDRSGGSPGYLMQTMCESAFELKVSVDACATGQFRPLDDMLAVPIVPGPPERWVVVAPTLRRPNETFAVGVKAEDAWGNPAAPGEERLSLECDPSCPGLPQAIRFAAGARAAMLDGLAIAREGTYRFTLLDRDRRVLALSNPLVIGETQHAAYWGDLHGQSGETVGINPIGEYLEFARDLAFLDVSGHQANDFQVTNAFWAEINATTERMNEDGRFVVFPGYEWSGNTAVGGDHNVFFRHEGRQIRRSSHAMLADRSDIGTDANTSAELFAKLDGEDCVVFAHVGGRPADIGYAHSPRLKTSVEVHSNWGTFEWILGDSLAAGHRVGVVCNSDGHKGRPGASYPGATEFGAYGGLTCFLAPRLTRDAIFECLRKRRHYGTTGSRLHLDVRARLSDATAEACMGDIVETDDGSLDVVIEVEAGSPIERVDVMHGMRCVQSLRTYGHDDLGKRLRVLWQGAEYRGRGRNTRWAGDIRFTGASVERMQAINRWNPERRLDLRDGARIAFEAVTTGNFAGVDLRLDRWEGASMAIATNLLEAGLQLGSIGLEDVVFDAGGLERRIVVRRLPDDLAAVSLKSAARVPLHAGRDNAIWVRVATLDGHLAWSSPIYVVRKA